MIILDFDNLNNINWFELDEVCIKKNDTKFYFKLNLKQEFDSVVIFSNGAIDRSIKEPPIFQRSNWKNDILSNTIFIDDPTVHDGSMSLGWGIGRPNHYYLETINEVLSIILKSINIMKENTTYFGSSAGGTMSMILASISKGSRAIVNNPQVRVEHFYSGNHLRKVINDFFPEYNEKQFIAEFKSRISVVEAFKKYNHCPEILYILNRASTFDYTVDYEFLLKDMQKNKLSLDSINFLIYNDKNRGHNPISQANTINIINNYSHNKNLWI